MPIISYYSLLWAIQDLKASIGITSSQILLSRGIADPGDELVSPKSRTAISQSSTTFFESSTHHIMTTSEAAALSTVSQLRGKHTYEEVMNLPSKNFSLENSWRRNAENSVTDSVRFEDNNTTPVLSNLVGYPEEEQEGLSNGETTEVVRGRSLQRTFRLHDPLERAQSRLLRDSATIELNVKPIEARQRRRSTFLGAFIEDSTDLRAVHEDNLLEPCPNDPVFRTVGDVMKLALPSIQMAVESNNGEVLVPADRNGQHTTTLPQKSLEGASITFTTRLTLDRTYLENEMVFGALHAAPTMLLDDLLQMRSTSRLKDNEALKSVTPLRASATPAASTRVPQEIIRLIYESLAPADFNSARHSCRIWYIASLERSMLQEMLKRGGWSGSILPEAAPNELANLRDINDEWLMSKSIARECALGPDWTGNGCSSAGQGSYCEHYPQPSKTTPFVCTSTTNFTESGLQHPSDEGETSGITFTVSTCGRFLMVAQGCLVYIYELNHSQSGDLEDKGRHSGTLRSVTSLICPRRVLACSMDTSSQRYAIAVLMDGRMGLVCDLTSVSERFWAQVPAKSQNDHSDTLPAAGLYEGGDYRNRVSINSSRHGPQQAPTGRAQRFTFPVIVAAGPSSNSQLSRESQKRAWQEVLQNDIPRSLISPMGHPECLSVKPNKLKEKLNCMRTQGSQMPIEQAVPTIYTPLCSADDPPRSVALCPQRRCVAFGCSSGIELHWVDALTGQDLNRWFPLTAPSDYLYFLPPRVGVDSAKKLRLISSAGRPGEKSVVAEKFGKATTSSTGGRSKTTPFWGNLSGRYSGPWMSLGAGDSDGSRVPNRDNSDHYRAIPLSDGYHLLFTDPTTGLLCLGNDAPIGGPTRLLRKIWFAGPPHLGSPITYAGASDLRNGVRVVAAYGTGYEQSVWLFSVPGDVFADNMAEQGSNSLSFVGNSLNVENSNREWVKWWNNGHVRDWLDPIQGGLGGALILKKDRVWPVQVRGQEVGKCRGLTDLAIDSGSEMTIWAFSKDGVAQTWQIDNGNQNGITKKQFIARDGTITEYDKDGDVEMCQGPKSIEASQETSPIGRETYDGTSSISASGYFADSLDLEMPPRLGFVDKDGDNIMTEADGVYGPDNPFETIALAHSKYETTNHDNGCAGRYYNEQVEIGDLRLLDEASGISRLDIEIR